jgi:hypothetical protein
VPYGRKGTFTAELDFDPGFKVKAEKITFSAG